MVSSALSERTKDEREEEAGVCDREEDGKVGKDSVKPMIGKV